MIPAPAVSSRLIVQLIPDLGVGGAEVVAINLANEWTQRGFWTRFVVLKREGVLESRLDPAVQVDELRATQFRFALLKLTKYLRSKKPAITVVHMWPLTLVAFFAWKLAGSPGKLYFCEHTNLIAQEKLVHPNRPLIGLKLSLRFIYPRASGVISVSKGIASELLKSSFGVLEDIKVIYNPIVRSDIELLSPLKTERIENLWGGKFSYYLISIGSLSEVKNHKLLISSFSSIAEKLDAGLVILGEGDQRSLLELQIKELKLESRISLPGFVPHPEVWLRNADLFILTSKFEGLPTVIIEALSYGIPVLSTRCPFGPEEILQEERHGFLVPVEDQDALARGIELALSRDWDYQSLRNRSLDFSISKQSEEYLRLFDLG